MSRQRSPLLAHRHDALLQRAQALKDEHSCWGYRRIWTYLLLVEQWPVNKKRKSRLMREHHLVVPPNRELKARRPPTGSQPRATKPNEGWGLDMTKLVVEDFGGALSWWCWTGSPKERISDYIGQSCPATHWLAALDLTVNRQCPNGARGQGISLMRDNGCQPASVACMPACPTRGMHQALTRDNNPKGNADTERGMRTLKEACLWLTEWSSPSELIRSLEAWIDYDNEHDLHLSLGDKPPNSTPFVAA